LRIHPIPQCCTFGNQFRPRNQFRPIPGIPELSQDGIPELGGISSGPGINSVQFLEFLNRIKMEFRNWVESVPAPESIPPIPGIPELGRN
jgi:hypothetical protein